MTKQTVKTSDLIQNGIFDDFQKNAKDVLKVLDELQKGLIDSAKAFEKIAKATDKTDSKSVTELMDAYKGVNEAQENSVKIIKAKKKVQEQATEIQKEQAKILKEEAKLREKIAFAESAEAENLALLRDRLNKVNAENRVYAKNINEVNDKYKLLLKNTNKAQLQFKKVAAELGVNSKEAKQARKEFERLDDELREINDAAKDGRRDVGRYGIAIEGLTGELEGLASQAGDTGGNLASLAKNLTNPIALGGAAVAAVGAAFTSTEEGSRKLNQTVAKAKGIFNSVTSSVGNFVVGLVEGKSASEAYNENLDGLIEKSTKAGEASAKAEEKQFDLNVALRTTGQELALLNAQYELLEGASGDATRTLEEQQVSTILAQNKAVEIAQKEKEIIAERISIINQELDARKGLASPELLDQRAELLAQEIEIEGRLNNELRALGQERRQIEQDQWEQRLDFLFDASDRQKSINEKILQDESVTIEERKQILSELQTSLKATYDQIQQEFRDASGQEINIAEFAKLDATEQAAQLKSLKLTEIERNRLREAVVEQLAVTQDLTDATKELNEAEREVVDTRAIVETQNEIIRQVEEGNLTIEEAQIKLEDDLLQIQIDSLEKQIAVRSDAGQETVAQQEELNTLLLDQQEQNAAKVIDKEKESLDARKKLAEDQIKVLGVIYDSVTDIITSKLDAKIDDINSKISDIERRQDQLSSAAANGSKDAIDSLVLEAKEQEKLRLKAEKEKFRLIKIEAALAAIRIAGQAAASGRPVTDALKDTVTIGAITQAIISGVPAFYEGTMDTGTVSKPLDSNGGRAAILHDNEGVINARDNKNILQSGLDHKDLGRLALLQSQGKLMSVSDMNSNVGIIGVKEPIVNTAYQLERVEKAILDLPQKMPKNSLHYDQQKKAMFEVSKTQYQQQVKAHKIKGGVFS